MFSFQDEKNLKDLVLVTNFKSWTFFCLQITGGACTWWRKSPNIPDPSSTGKQDDILWQKNPNLFFIHLLTTFITRHAIFISIILRCSDSIKCEEPQNEFSNTQKRKVKLAIKQKLNLTNHCLFAGRGSLKFVVPQRSWLIAPYWLTKRKKTMLPEMD